MLLMQMVADVLAAAFVAHDHFVPALAAPGDAVQQGGAIARDPAALGAQIIAPIVAQDGLDLLEGLPAHIGGIFVLHDNPPFRHRPWRLLRAP